MTDSGHLTTQEVSYDYSWSEADRAGCPYCGINSYYPRAARYKDDKLEGYECSSCKRKFSKKDIAHWIGFLSRVIDGCREDALWSHSLGSLAAAPPPFHLHEIAEDRMAYLNGEKTIVQITDPAHCRDDLIRRDLLGDVTLQRASETLSKSLRDAYEKQTAENVFQKGQKNWIIAFKGKTVPLENSTVLGEIQHLLKNPDTPVSPFRFPDSDAQTPTVTAAQIRELLLEGGLSVSDLRDKDQYSQVTKIDGVQANIAEDIHKAFQEYQNGLKEELTTATPERSLYIKSILKKTRALETKLEREQSQKAKAAKNAKKRISYLIENKITPHHEKLARYLHKTIRREHNCLIYRPDQDHPIVWEF